MEKVVGGVEAPAVVVEEVMRYEAGALSAVQSPVQAERLVDVSVNGRSLLRMSCTATHLAELVVGRLYAERVIDGADEIASIDIDAREGGVQVRLAGSAERARVHEARVRLARREVDTTGGSNAISWRDGRLEHLSPVAPIAWNPEWILTVAREFARDKTLHARTRGSHSAYLASGESILCVQEDIGRHNAIDKAVGWALMNGADLTECLLFTSGRVPLDMVAKAVRARVPILVSKSVPTDQGAALARACGLTLLCMAQPDSFLVVSDGERSLSENGAGFLEKGGEA